MDFGKDKINKNLSNVRMSGFLEKKGKMKLMSGWKKYWFVLEERLLLYYRSEVEYTNLSPCRGSLNMGLVSTVRPGSSSGPCIIHVITRTQVVQLRAKNRTVQEEWLQALLNSISLPLIKKIPKPPTPLTNYLGSSLENISSSDRLKQVEKTLNHDVENEWTIPRITDYRRRQISGTLYGGSLDTAIWSRKCKQLRTPSPKMFKANVLERILSFSKDSDSLSLRAFSRKQSGISLNDDNEMKFLGNKYQIDEEIEEKESIECKFHEDRNHDIYSIVDKSKKKFQKTLSDTELNKISTFENLGRIKTEKKEDSPFGRIRNVLSRTTKAKALKTIPQEAEKKGRPSNKRRRSFLQKVFRKKDCDHNMYDSHNYDPLYYTIENVKDPRSLVSLNCSEDNNISFDETEKNTDVNSNEGFQESLYAEIQKTIVGSKTILSAQTMTELKTRLRTRESLKRQHINSSENYEVNEENNSKEFSIEKDKKSSPPTLPPRRVSRPISPWHDVPTNNTPINGDKSTFFVHQSIVKFHDTSGFMKIDIPKTENEVYNDVQCTYCHEDQNEFHELQPFNTKKNDNLSELLEQLTEITVAPFSQTEVSQDNEDCSHDSQILKKPQNVDPDYDIPRPHNLVNIIAFESNEIIPPTDFLGRYHNDSDTSLSFQSMEPDSLENTGRD